MPGVTWPRRRREMAVCQAKGRRDGRLPSNRPPAGEMAVCRAKGGRPAVFGQVLQTAKFRRELGQKRLGGGPRYSFIVQSTLLASLKTCIAVLHAGHQVALNATTATWHGLQSFAGSHSMQPRQRGIILFFLTIFRWVPTTLCWRRDGI